MPPKSSRRRAAPVNSPPLPNQPRLSSKGASLPQPSMLQSAATTEPSTPLAEPSTPGVGLPALPTTEGQASTSTHGLVAPPLSLTQSAANSATAEGRVSTYSIRCRNPQGKYRVIASNKTSAIVRTTGKKIELHWSPFHQGPDSKKTNDGLVRDIGAAVRTHVPMLASTYSQLEKKHQDAVLAYLENIYEIDPADTNMINYIHAKAHRTYKDWKSTCKKLYEQRPDELPSEFELRPEEWQWLITNEFEDEKKKALCKRNQSNRTKNPNQLNHHLGPVAVSYKAEEWAQKGSLAPFVEVAIHAYEKCPNGKEQVGKLKNSLEEIKKTHEPGESSGTDDSEVQQAPLSKEQQCDILIDAFGERRGTEVRGMGCAARRPAKKRGGSWTAEAAAKRRELEDRTRKAEEDAEKARQQSEKANEELVLMRSDNDILRGRVLALEEFMTNFSKLHPTSKGPDASHAPETTQSP